jgi:hypothetical protein
MTAPSKNPEPRYDGPERRKRPRHFTPMQEDLLHRARAVSRKIQKRVRKILDEEPKKPDS